MSQQGVDHRETAHISVTNVGFLRRSLIFLTIGVLFFVVAIVPKSAIASPQLAGTATSCSSFYTCKYIIVSSLGPGSAATYGYINFQLPGETKSTTNQPYTVAILGHTGNIYHVGGSFTAIDANTEKVVTGTTNDYIIQTQHCGLHGCWYTYSLSSGRITFTLTNLDGTNASLACNPPSILSGGSTLCTVTITDLANSRSFPAGRVRFGFSGYGGYGTITPSTCVLSSGSCSVTFSTFDETVGGVGIIASYPGDLTHYISTGSTTVYVTGN